MNKLLSWLLLPFIALYFCSLVIYYGVKWTIIGYWFCDLCHREYVRKNKKNKLMIKDDIPMVLCDSCYKKYK